MVTKASRSRHGTKTAGTTKRTVSKPKSNDVDYSVSLSAVVPETIYGDVEQSDGGVRVRWKKPRTSKHFETIVPNDQIIAAKVADNGSGGFVVRLVSSEVTAFNMSGTEISGGKLAGLDEDGNTLMVNPSLCASLGMDLNCTTSEAV